MKITKNEIEHVAHLARLDLSSFELDTITTQLDTILSYVAKLDELNTDGIEPTTHAFSITNAFREDIKKQSLEQQEALQNSEKVSSEAFIVPRVI